MTLRKAGDLVFNVLMLVAGLAAMLLALVLFLLVCWGLIGGMGWLALHSALPSQLAQIEQLRRDAAVTDPVRAEDVIGQVTQWNQTIEANRAQNQTWWAGWFTPDEWDRVELIPVPRTED